MKNTYLKNEESCVIAVESIVDGATEIIYNEVIDGVTKGLTTSATLKLGFEVKLAVWNCEFRVPKVCQSETE